MYEQLKMPKPAVDLLMFHRKPGFPITLSKIFEKTSGQQSPQFSITLSTETGRLLLINDELNSEKPEHGKTVCSKVEIGFKNEEGSVGK